MTMLPNILFILTISSDSVSFPDTYEIPSIKFCKFNYYYISDKWCANLYSLFSGTMPSQHQIWNINHQPGLHTQPITSILTQARYRGYFLSAIDLEPLIKSLAFSNFELFENLNPFESIRTILSSNDAKDPLFITIILPNWTPTEKDQFKQILIQKTSKSTRPTIYFGLSLQPKVHKQSKEDNLPAYLAKSILNCAFLDFPLTYLQQDSLISLVDIPVTLLKLLNMHPFYGMVGRDLSYLFQLEKQKTKSNTRNSVLFEYTNGSKMLISKEHKVIINLNQNRGKVFNYLQDPEELHDLWTDPTFQPIKQRLLLQMLWAQLEKESMPMPRIAGA